MTAPAIEYLAARAVIFEPHAGGFGLHVAIQETLRAVRDALPPGAEVTCRVIRIDATGTTCEISGSVPRERWAL